MTHSLLGPHSVIGPRNWFAEFLRKLANAKKNLIIKMVDDFGPAFEAREIYGPALFDEKVITVGRVNVMGGRDMQAWEPVGKYQGKAGAIEAAKEYFNLVVEKWVKNPHVQIWETFNEFAFWWEWQGFFYIAMMDQVEASGLPIKLSHYAASSGNPATLAFAQEMVECLQETKRRDHYLSLHEYGGVGTNIKTLQGTQPYHALRYRALYRDVLEPNNADCMLILSEIGQAGGFYYLGQDLFTDYFWYDSELVKDQYVKGATIFTLGDWYQSNWQNSLRQLADYMINVEHPEHPEPSEPDPGDAWPESYNRTSALYTLKQYVDPQWTEPAQARGLTVTQSAHDTGISPGSTSKVQLNDNRIIVINPAEWGNTPTIRDWIGMRFENVDQYQEIAANTPADLDASLAALVGPRIVIDDEADPIPPPQPPRPPVDATLFGLHGPAHGWQNEPAFNEDFAMIDVGRFDALLMMTNADFKALDRVLRDHPRIPPHNIMLRLFVDLHNRTMSGAIFYEQQKLWIAYAYKHGIRKFHIHNEPNRVDGFEGMRPDGPWQGPQGFVDWYAEAAQLILADFPDALLFYPGLQPNPNTALWLPTIRQLINRGLVQGIGIHSYFNPGLISHPEHGGYWKRYRDQYPDVPREITEFSIPYPDVSDQERAAAFIEWMNQVDAQAAYLFVSSARPGDYPHEVLKGTTIPALIGARPRPQQTLVFFSWPTDHRPMHFTQRFGENPQDYAQFGLPGHEGDDIRAPLGAKVLAPSDGVVVEVGYRRPDHPYGYAVRIRADRIDGQYTIILAHGIDGSAQVSIGDEVRTGDHLMDVGETGNTRGAHIHQTLLKKGALNGGYGEIIDPAPFYIEQP